MSADLFRQIKLIKKKVQRNDELIKKYNKCGKEVLIQEDPDGGVGGSLWEAGIVLLDYIEKVYTEDNNAFVGKKAIELGSGTGIAAILLAVLGADVVATDRADTVDLLNLSISLNEESYPGYKIQAKELEWGNISDSDKDDFDIILVSDCIYNSLYYGKLLSTIIDLSNEKTVVYFSYLPRNPEEPAFFQTVSQTFNINIEDERKDGSKMMTWKRK